MPYPLRVEQRMPKGNALCSTALSSYRGLVAVYSLSPRTATPGVGVASSILWMKGYENKRFKVMHPSDRLGSHSFQSCALTSRHTNYSPRQSTEQTDIPQTWAAQAPPKTLPFLVFLFSEGTPTSPRCGGILRARPQSPWDKGGSGRAGHPVPAKAGGVRSTN